MASEFLGTPLANGILGLLRGDGITYNNASGLALIATADQPSGGAYTAVVNAGYSDFSLLISHWGSAVDGLISNAQRLNIFTASGTDDGSVLATVRGWAVEDVGTGNTWFVGVLNDSVAMVNGDEFYWPVGSLKIQGKNNALSIPFRNKILNLLKGQSINAAPYYEIHLLENAPVAGVANTRLSVGGYEPLQVTAEAAQWLAPTARTTHNLLALEFTALTATAPKIGGFEIADDQGEVLWQGPIAPEKIAYKDYILKILPEGVVLSI